jgi:hypothetical protein
MWPFSQYSVTNHLQKFFSRKIFDSMSWFLIIILDNFIWLLTQMKVSLFFYRKWSVKMTGKVRIWPDSGRTLSVDRPLFRALEKVDLKLEHFEQSFSNHPCLLMLDYEVLSYHFKSISYMKKIQFGPIKIFNWNEFFCPKWIPIWKFKFLYWNSNWIFL